MEQLKKFSDFDSEAKQTIIQARVKQVETLADYLKITPEQLAKIINVTNVDLARWGFEKFTRAAVYSYIVKNGNDGFSEKTIKKAKHQLQLIEEPEIARLKSALAWQSDLNYYKGGK